MPTSCSSSSASEAPSMLVQKTVMACGRALATSRTIAAMVSGSISEKSKLTLIPRCLSATSSKPSAAKLRRIAATMSSVYGETMPKRRTPVARKISSSASTEEQARTCVRASMARQSSRSRSKPSHPAEVPVQQIEWQCASARSSAAASIGSSWNWPSACWPRLISVTRKRPKCGVTSGNPASMRAVTGSSVVLDEGVSIPRNRRSLFPISVSELPRQPGHDGGELHAQHQHRELHGDERPDIGEQRIERYLARARHHEKQHADRRRQHADHQVEDEHEAEMERVEAVELGDRREQRHQHDVGGVRLEEHADQH